MSAATALLASNSFCAVFLAPSAEQTKAFSSPVAACLQTWHQHSVGNSGNVLKDHSTLVANDKWGGAGASHRASYA